MKKLLLLSVLLAFGILVLQSGCKKDEEQKPAKKLDFVTDNSGFFRIDLVYSGNEIQEMIYKAVGDSVVLSFENGLLKQEMYSNGGHVDYISDGNNINTVRSWNPDSISNIFQVNNGNQVVGLTDILHGETEKVYKYSYLNGNLIKQEVTFPNNELIGEYTYDQHPNPYRGIVVFGDVLTYSANNLITKDGDTIAYYIYDEDGYVTEANYKGGVVYTFSYQ